MDIRDRRAMKYSAGQALAAAPGDPKFTVLTYAGITALLALVLTAVSFLLENRIADTGGLSNLGLRSILSTVQSVLPIAQVIVLVCLELGYASAALKMSRGRAVTPRTLLDGFLRFGPLLRSLILQGMLYLAACFASTYAASFIVMMTPLSQGFYEAIEPLMASATVLSNEIVLDEATLAAATRAMLPMIPIFLAIFAAVTLPILYQYRMVSFCLLDAPRPGALAAMHESRMMMRGNRLSLFKLDLSFWWFYLLQVLVSVVAYGDTLLPMVGIALPWSDTVSYFLFYILSLAMQVAVYYLFLNRVQITYAMAYESLRPQPQEPRTQGVPLGNIFDMR